MISTHFQPSARIVSTSRASRSVQGRSISAGSVRQPSLFELEQIGDDLSSGLAIGIEAREDHPFVGGGNMIRRETAADAARTAVEGGRVESPILFLRRARAEPLGGQPRQRHIKRSKPTSIRETQDGSGCEIGQTATNGSESNTSITAGRSRARDRNPKGRDSGSVSAAPRARQASRARPVPVPSGQSSRISSPGEYDASH
jgi:hypothetical protein